MKSFCTFGDNRAQILVFPLLLERFVKAILVFLEIVICREERADLKSSVTFPNLLLEAKTPDLFEIMEMIR